MTLLSLETESLVVNASVLTPGSSINADFEFSEPPSTLGFVFQSSSNQVLIDLYAAMLLSGYNTQIMKDINTNNGFPVLLLKTYKNFRATIHLPSGAPGSETVSLWIIGSAHSFSSSVGVSNFPSVQTVSPAVITASNILGGSATANATTLVIVPAGRVWKGNVCVSLAQTATALTTGVASISVQGTGATPAAGTLLVSAQQDLATGVGATGVTNQNNDVYVAAPVGNAVTLRFDLSGTTFVGTGIANGILL